MAKGRNSRQEAIRVIVRNNAIRTQRELVEELRGQGFVCTQATVSRDIADMGLRKLHEGKYVLAEDMHLQRMISEFVVSQENIDNQLVIHSQAGTASGVAAAIDAAERAGVACTIAGNDTVLVICRGREYASKMVKIMQQLRSYR